MSTNTNTDDHEPTHDPQIDAETEDALTVIVRNGVLQDALDAVNAVASEAILRIGHNGLDIAVVDPGNVAMAIIDIDADAFESVGDGQFPIGVNTVRFEDYLGPAGSDDLVRLGYRHEIRKLNIQHTNTQIDTAAIDPDAIRQEPDLPELDLPNTFTLPAGEFQTALGMIDLVSDHVHIACEPDNERVAIRSKGDTDDLETIYGHNDLTDARLREESESLYSLDYLKDIVGAIPTGAPVTVTIGTEFPVIIAYPCADGDGRITFNLAPRIQSD